MLKLELEMPLLTKADVIVCGGGAAGVAAAIAAARNGADTVLVEKAGYAGGMMTGGLLPSIISMTDRRNMLAGGICREMVDELSSRMGVKADYFWQNINPELLKVLLDEMLVSSGVRVFFGLQTVAVLKEEQMLHALAVATPSGIKVIEGKVFIDATGDGTVAFLSGAPFEYGDDATGETMAPTLCSMFANVDFPSNKEKFIGKIEWEKLTALEKAPFDEHHFVGFFRCGNNMGCGNLGHIYESNPLLETELTRCFMEGRRQAAMLTSFYKNNVPGFAQSELCATASQLGIRESRRILGEYVLKYPDYLDRRHFPDEIACFAYPVDVHAGRNNRKAQASVEIELERTRMAPGENYGIPFRTLLPRNTENLLVAGRCISTDRKMQSSIRVVPGCMLTGEAAGVAAAYTVNEQCTLRTLDIKIVQKYLCDSGVYLP